MNTLEERVKKLERENALLIKLAVMGRDTISGKNAITEICEMLAEKYTEKDTPQ